MILNYVPAEAADIPVIYAQAKELIDTYEDVACIDYEKVLVWVKQKITANIHHYCCVTVDGEKCAYYRLCEDGELDDLYVLSDFRNRGIGSEIIRKCIADSVNPLHLYVFRRNTRAISFYEKLDFTLRETVGTTRYILERKG